MDSRSQQSQQDKSNSSLNLNSFVSFVSQEEPLSAQTIKSQFDSCHQQPSPLFVHDLQANQFQLSSIAQSSLASLKGECYVISVSGSPLVGKSSLLNLLVFLFKNHEINAFKGSEGPIPFKEIYTVGNGKKSTTEGIDMFWVTVRGKNYIFLDIEGDNDPKRKETGVWFYTNLIQTALGVSHIHIYNYNGVPQETFLKYFKSIHTIINQTKLHQEFQTKLLFLKRDHEMQDDQSFPQELEEIRSSFDHKRFAGQGLDYSIHFLPRPPKHVTKRNSSCLISTGVLCESCEKKLFFTPLNEIFNELNSHLKQNQVTAFKNGKAFLEAVQRILKINAQKFQFCEDEGNISNLCGNKWQQKQLQINDILLGASRYEIESGASKLIDKLMNEFQNPPEIEFAEKFKNNQITLAIKLSQLKSLVPELRDFIINFLFDENNSILDEKEEEMIFGIYVSPFEKLSKEILANFKVSEQLIHSICTNIQTFKNVREPILQALVEYMKVSGETSRNGCLFLGSSASSGLRIFTNSVSSAATGYIGTTLILGLMALSGIQFVMKYDEKQRKKEFLDSEEVQEKIRGIDSKEKAETELKKMQVSMPNILENLQKTNYSISKICLDGENANSSLVKIIKEVMKEKLEGTQLTQKNRSELKRLLKDVENNLERREEAL